MIWNQAAALESLADHLTDNNVPIALGVPRSIQVYPSCYVLSISTDVANSRLLRYRPTLTAVLALQEAAYTEIETLTVTDRLANMILGGRLEEVCTTAIESVQYGYRTIAGIDYRVVDFQLVLSMAGGRTMAPAAFV